MAIISIFSGAYCSGEEISDKLAQYLGYTRVDQKILEDVSRTHGIPKAKLKRILRGERPFLNRFTHEFERSVAYLRLALVKRMKTDNLVCHGNVSHLLPRNVSHVLWVCLIANHDYRARSAMEELSISRKMADKMVDEDDLHKARWTQQLYSRNPYDRELYDIVLPMHSMSVEQAVDRISKYVDQPAVRTSEESRRRIQDSLLAAEVGVALVKLGSGLQITASEGHVFIKINEYVVNLDRYKKKLKKFASEVPGVESVECAPGTGFVPPSLTRSFDPEIPSKILLVDDEPEFVQTLSERLQTRNLETSVAYGGEEALSLIATDEPEVMVLDLKMPGVDGMEVLRRVRRDHPNIEVIILTGHGSEKEREMARDLGAFAYLRKPVNIDELADVMKRAYQKVEARKKSKTKGE